MAAESPLQQTQEAFTAHLRDPQQYPPPADVEDRRMGIYRDLLFNNINGFLQSGFPVLHSLYDDADWLRLVRRFFAEHRSQTPYFSRIAEEFLQFLQQEYAPQPEDPAFLLELAHYEWVELALAIHADAADQQDINPHGDLLQALPVVSELAWPLAYQWPVHRISADNQPQTPPPTPTYLVVWRNAAGAVEFMETNAVTARLIQLLQEGTVRSGSEAIDIIAAELQHPEPLQLRDAGHQILLKLLHAGILIGTQTRQQG